MRGRVPAPPPEQLLHASADSDLAARIGAVVGAGELGQHALGIDDLGKLGAVPHPLLTAEQRQRTSTRLRGLIPANTGHKPAQRGCLARATIRVGEPKPLPWPRPRLPQAERREVHQGVLNAFSALTISHYCRLALKFFYPFPPLRNSFADYVGRLECPFRSSL